MHRTIKPILAYERHYIRNIKKLQIENVGLKETRKYSLTVKAGVLQSTILEHLLFIIYINDISRYNSYVDDDTILCSERNSVETAIQ